MKRNAIGFAAGVITFLLSSVFSGVAVQFQPSAPAHEVTELQMPASSSSPLPLIAGPPSLLTNSKDAEIVRQAEYFIAWNGFTDRQPGGTGKLYFERGENPDDRDQIWRRRYATLEGKAYGLIKWKKGGSRFWTVVFRYTERAGKDGEKVGRAYTVEEDRFGVYFLHFRHNFPLRKVKDLL